MGEIIRPGIVLFIVTAIAAACLGAVYGITEEPIARQKLETRNLALRELLPDADDFNEIELSPDSSVSSCFAGISGAAETGYVLGVSADGYGGPIDMMVALDTDGVIRGLKIVGHTETPGLGANAKNSEFTDQFIGKNGVISATKSEPTQASVQVITSATITTQAVVDGANLAIQFFEENLRGGR